MAQFISEDGDHLVVVFGQRDQLFEHDDLADGNREDIGTDPGNGQRSR